MKSHRETGGAVWAIMRDAPDVLQVLRRRVGDGLGVKLLVRLRSRLHLQPRRLIVRVALRLKLAAGEAERVLSVVVENEGQDNGVAETNVRVVSVLHPAAAASLADPDGHVVLDEFIERVFGVDRVNVPVLVLELKVSAPLRLRVDEPELAAAVPRRAPRHFFTHELEVLAERFDERAPQLRRVARRRRRGLLTSRTLKSGGSERAQGERDGEGFDFRGAVHLFGLISSRPCS